MIERFCAFIADIWAFLLDPANRAVLTWIAGGLVGAAGGVLTLLKFKFPTTDSKSASDLPQATTHATPESAVKKRLSSASAAPSDRIPSKDFLTGFFKNDVEFFNRIRLAATTKATAAENVKIGKLIVLHYIREDFQIGFRAYEELSLIKYDTDGVLPLYVVTDRGGPASIVDYFEWNDDSRPPEIGSKTAPPKSTPVLTVSAKGPRHVSIFQFYRDPVGPGDWFRVNPFSVGSDVILNHYVVVQNEDLTRWNPNKFVFQVEPDGTIGFSSAVYTTVSSRQRPVSPHLLDAQELLSKFLAIPDSALTRSPPATHLVNVREYVNQIFRKDSFLPNVTVFRLQRKADESNLLLVYAFPTPR
jgi:hypothetical protein